MSRKEEVNTVFSLFHDGSIDAIQANNRDLVLKIGTYLAIALQPDFTYFILKLFNVKRFEFDLWTAGDARIINDPGQIEELNIQILGENNPAGNGIVCAYFDTSHQQGELHVDAERYEIWTQDGKQIAAGEMESIVKRYWSTYG